MQGDNGRPAGHVGRRTLLKSAGLVATSAGVGGCFELFSSTESGTPSPTVPPPATPSPSETASETPEVTESQTATPATQGASYIYVSQAQLAAVAERVRNDDAPWRSAYKRAMKDADKALNFSPRSVVDDGTPKWDDPHRFGKDEKRHDYRAALKMTTAVRDAALGYWFTREDRYAERAIDLLYHWCLNPETYMAPNADMANNNVSIELWITIPKLWYGASLLGDHPYWTEKRNRDLESEFERWTRSFVESIPAPPYYQYNNMWAWRIQTLAAAGAYLGDQELLDRAFAMWRAERKTAAHGTDRPRPWSQYRQWNDDAAKGYLKRELARNDGFNYHVYGTKALTMTAEIAHHHGIDLYTFNAPTDPERGSTLKKLFDWMVPYLKDPAKWKWGVGSNGLSDTERGNYASLYELAYSRWQDPKYLDVVKTVGRPAYDFWMLGWTTLTHGNLFQLDVQDK